MFRDRSFSCKNKLNEVNTTVFNAVSRSLYSTLVRLVELVPTERDVDAQQYAGRLEAGIRRFLFAGYYENGGATGNQVLPNVIQMDARDQLLRRLVVTSGTISGEGIAATKLDEQGPGQAGRACTVVAGRCRDTELGDYELVVEQLQRAARELGLEVCRLWMPRSFARTLRNPMWSGFRHT